MAEINRTEVASWEEACNGATKAMQEGRHAFAEAGLHGKYWIVERSEQENCGCVGALTAAEEALTVDRSACRYSALKAALEYLNQARSERNEAFDLLRDHNIPLPKL